MLLCASFTISIVCMEYKIDLYALDSWNSKKFVITFLQLRKVQRKVFQSRNILKEVFPIFWKSFWIEKHFEKCFGAGSLNIWIFEHFEKCFGAGSVADGNSFSWRAVCCPSRRRKGGLCRPHSSSSPSLLRFLNVFHTIYNSFPMSCKCNFWKQNS